MGLKADASKIETMKESIALAQGHHKADLAIRHVTYLDVFRGTFRKGDVLIAKGKIVALGEGYQAHREIDGTGRFLVPGFIDAHVHLESSLLTPVRYAELVLRHGTTSVVWDPHEIANALGAVGLRWALEASRDLMLSVFVMAPSCVPAVSESMGLESSGHTLDAAALAPFHDEPRVVGLGEMMNIPGLLMGDTDVLKKLIQFSDRHIDGHCPGITGRTLAACVAAGVGTCHESLTADEGAAKLAMGMALLVREGSCAQNADALLGLIDARSAMRIALCSDDLNPADIARRGHIDHIIDKGLRMGIAPEDIFRSASYSAAQIFGLKGRGAIAPGHVADLVFVAPADGKTFASGLAVGDVIVGGKLLAECKGRCAAKEVSRPSGVRNIRLSPVSAEDFVVSSHEDGPQRVRVIEIVPEQIVTRSLEETLVVAKGKMAADPARDLLKIAVFERYHGTSGHAVGFVKGFGLTEGAIAASISHDAHNVVVVGCDDQSMAAAVNRVITMDGGIVVIGPLGECHELPLPIGGLMTDAPSAQVVATLSELKEVTHQLGSALPEPFLQLAFLSLPVIGKLKLTDKGLVDVDLFKVVELFV